MLKEKEEKVENKENINSNQQFELIYSPRTTYSIDLDQEEVLYNDLTLNFDPITINIIKKHFKERLGSLNRIEFVSILKNHLLSWHPNHPNREKLLVKLLSRLFGEIDLNDNGSMEWAEFCNYIIHNSNAVNNKHDSSNFRLRCYSVSRHSIDTVEFNEAISYTLYIEKYNLVGLVEEGKCIIHFYDANNYKKLNAQIDLKTIMSFMDESEEIEKDKEKEKSDENKHKKFTEDAIRKKKNIAVVFKKLTILSSLFLPEYDILLISSSNKRVTAWKYNDSQFHNINTVEKKGLHYDKNNLNFNILISNSPQYRMAFDNIGKNLYTGHSDGKINKWDLSKVYLSLSKSLPVATFDLEYEMKLIEKTIEKQSKENADDFNRRDERETSEKDNKTDRRSKSKKSFLKKKKVDNSLGNGVTALVVIAKIQVLAAGYLNGKIVLWDILQMKIRKTYDNLKTGVFDLAYDAGKNLLFSCGKDHDIYVFDPYIEFPVYVLSGHAGSVSTVICNEKENELISLDIYGTIKVWDTQLLVCFQNINLNESAENNRVMIKENNRLGNNMKISYHKKQRKIMVYNNKVTFYETDKSLNPELADDQIIFASFYDKISKTIISFSLRKIKMWNPLTGKIKNVFEDPMKNEITALTLDRNMKRTFLGDNTGQIKCFNMKNGKFLKSLTSHSLEINMLIHSLSLNIVVSCSVDNVVKIHDDTELLETSVIKVINIYGNQVKCISIMELMYQGENEEEDVSRLVFGLSNGVIKFYDIEHFRYDSDIITDVANLNDDATCIHVFNNHPVVFSCHNTGTCKFMWTPPSVSKFRDFYSFKNVDAKNATNYVPVTCLDFDQVNQRMFCGDQLGVIKCYSFKEIFSIIEEFNINKDEKLFIQRFENLKTTPIWKTDAHKESIKHINYTDINPNLILTTSHDLRIKLFNANTGLYLDELKQGSSKYNSVPTGIKYRGIDPITKQLNVKLVERKSLNPFDIQSIDEIENIPIAEYSKQINYLNAKEKLLSYVKSTKLHPERSNLWNLNIDVESLKAQEEENIKLIWDDVKMQENIILKTEMIMQSKSIYHPTYKPLFINEMPKENIKEFSNNLSNKLRQIKLAISKANINNKSNKNGDGSKNSQSSISFKGLESNKSKNTLLKDPLLSTDKVVVNEVSPFNISQKDREKMERDKAKEIERKMLYGTFKRKIDIFDMRQIEESALKNEDELKLISNEINKNKRKQVKSILPPIRSPSNALTSKNNIF